MSITIQPQDETPQLREEVAVRLPDSLYNVFVSKFHSDLIVAPTNVSEIEVFNTNTSSNTKETYTYSPVANLLYSNMFVKSTKPTLTFSNVNTYSDRQALLASMMIPTKVRTIDVTSVTYQASSTGLAEGAFGDAITPLNINKNGIPAIPYSQAPVNLYSPTETGNANPFQAPMFGLATDFINAIQAGMPNSVALGDNGQNIEYTPASVKHVDLQRRKLSNYELEKFDGMRIPDRCLNSQYILPYPKRYCGSALDTNPNANQAIYSTLYTSNVIDIDSPLPLIEDLENDMSNALNSTLRGAIFRHKKPRYVFTKKMPSQNYEATASIANGTVIMTPLGAPTTSLYTLVIGQYVFPSNIENCQYLYDNQLLPFHQIVYCTDSLHAMHSLNITAAGDLSIYVMSEPQGQSMTVTLSFDEPLLSPMLNPLLSDINAASWANASTLRVLISLGADYDRYVSYCHDFGPQKLYPMNTTDGIQVNIQYAESKLIILQTTFTALGGKIQDVVTLPFLNMIFSKDEARQLRWTANANDVLTQTATFQDEKIGGSIPKYAEIFVDRPGCVIKKLQVVVNGVNDVMNTRTWTNLYDCTKDNGIIQYTFNDALGYPNRYKKTPGKDPRSINYGSGTVLFLDFSQDITLGNSLLTAGSGGHQLSIKYIVTYECPGLGKVALNTDYDVRVYVNHYSQSIYTINDNNRADYFNSIYTIEDVKNAIQKLIHLTSSKNLYVNMRRFYGGALGSFMKARTMLPKIYHGAVKANEGVKLAQQTAEAMAPHVMGMASEGRKLAPAYQDFFKR